MIKIKLVVLVLLNIMFSVQANAQNFKSNDIVGVWLSEDKNGELGIYKKDGKFFGKLIKVHDNKGIENDIHNPDKSKRKRKVVGLIILTNFVYEGNGEWEDGKIYDPNSGNTYSCIIEMQNKNTIEVTGYIGFSLFGRTEKWTRIK